MQIGDPTAIAVDCIGEKQKTLRLILGDYNVDRLTDKLSRRIKDRAVVPRSAEGDIELSQR